MTGLRDKLIQTGCEGNLVNVYDIIDLVDRTASEFPNPNDYIVTGFGDYFNIVRWKEDVLKWVDSNFKSEVKRT